jgi:hypothetical protein
VERRYHDHTWSRHHAFVEPAPQAESKPDPDAAVRARALTRMANRHWSDIMHEKGDIKAVDSAVRDAYAAGMRDAAILVEFADLLWRGGDPRTRIATELRQRAADAIARRGSVPE